MRTRERVNDFANVAAGGYTTLSLDPSGHYYGLLVAFNKLDEGSLVPMSTAEIIADVDYIHVELSKKGDSNTQAKRVVKISPARLLAWLDWRYGEDSLYAPDGCLRIPFTRNRLPRVIGGNIVTEENTFGLGTLDVSSLSIAIKFINNAEFATEQVVLKRDHDRDINVPLGTYPVLFESERNLANTGSYPLRDLPKQIKGAAHLSMHITEGTGTITELEEVTLGNKAIRQHVDATEHAVLAHEAGRRPQEGVWSIDFQQNRGWLSVDNTMEFETKVEWSVEPGQFFLIHDMLEGLGN
jgi:hypothetical protein